MGYSFVRRVLAPDEKPLHWVGSSKDDLLGFPERVKDDMGNALGTRSSAVRRRRLSRGEALAPA